MLNRRISPPREQRIARRGCHELFDRRDVADAAACSGAGAVQRSSGAGKVELAIERPILQEAVDEAGVKDIAGAGGVDDRHAIGGTGMEIACHPRQGRRLRRALRR